MTQYDITPATTKLHQTNPSPVSAYLSRCSDYIMSAYLSRWARRLGAADSFPLSPGGDVGVPSPGLYLVYAQVEIIGRLSKHSQVEIIERLSKHSQVSYVDEEKSHFFSLLLSYQNQQSKNFSDFSP